VGTYFNTGGGLTISAQGQFDHFQRFLFQIFDQAQPDGRSVAMEASSGELLIEYREGGTVILEGRFPIPLNDRKFHEYTISFDSTAHASFSYDGDFYMTTPFPPSVVWMSFSSHSFPGTPTENLVHVDNVRVTAP
jgi:hypothetical protein